MSLPVLVFSNDGTPTAGQAALEALTSLSKMHSMNLMDQLNQIKAQGLSDKNRLFESVEPGTIAATNATNQATAQTAVPMAHANLTTQQEKNKYLPLTTAIAAQNSLNKQQQLGQMGSRFGTAYQLARMVQSLPNAVRDQWFSIPGNAANYNRAIAIVGNQLFNQSPSQSAGLSKNFLIPALQKAGLLSLAPSKANTVTQNIPPVLQQLYDRTQKTIQQDQQPIDVRHPSSMTVPPALQSLFNPAQQEVAQTQSSEPPHVAANQLVPAGQTGFQPLSGKRLSDVTDVARSAAQKATHTTAQLNQTTYGISSRNFYNQAGSLIPSVLKFTGFKGSFNALLNNLASRAGNNNNPDYTNLLKFKRTMVLFANEFRKHLGAQATDKEIKLINETTMPNLSKMTPTQVVALYYSLGDSLNSQEKVTSSSIAEQHREAQHASNAPIVIPSFKNKLEFQQWFSILPLKERKQVLNQLR